MNDAEVRAYVEEFLAHATIAKCGIGTEIEHFKTIFPDAEWNNRGKRNLHIAHVGPFRVTFLRKKGDTELRLNRCGLQLDELPSNDLRSEVSKWIAHKMQSGHYDRLVETENGIVSAEPDEYTPGQWQCVQLAQKREEYQGPRRGGSRREWREDDED